MVFWMVSILMSFLGGKVKWKENSRLKFEALSSRGYMRCHFTTRCRSFACMLQQTGSVLVPSSFCCSGGETGPSLSQQGFKEWIRTITCCWRGQVTTCDVTWPTIVFNAIYIYTYESLLQLMLWCFWCFDAERRRKTYFTCNMSG